MSHEREETMSCYDVLTAQLENLRCQQEAAAPVILAAQQATQEAQCSLEQAQRAQRESEKKTDDADAHTATLEKRNADLQGTTAELRRQTEELNGQIAESPTGLQASIHELHQTVKQTREHVSGKGEEKQSMSMKLQALGKYHKKAEAFIDQSVKPTEDRIERAARAKKQSRAARSLST